MEIRTFIENFADQFDEIDVDKLAPNTVFHDLDEYSSIVALSIIAMIDEEYGVAIGAEEMRSSVTIEDLFNIVLSKK